MISGLIIISAAITNITISWKLPNGIITVYEIRYRESTTDPYNITNTTSTQYSIVGLIPNTSYTIGVRAYTSVGLGEWTDREFTSTKIRKNFYLLNKSLLLYSIAIVKGFLVSEINSTAVRADWGSVTGASHFTVYYQSTSKRKRQADTGMRVFPGDTTNGVIGGLAPNLDYLFSISASYNINGMIFEGQKSQPIPPSMCCTL